MPGVRADAGRGGARRVRRRRRDRRVERERDLLVGAEVVAAGLLGDIFRALDDLSSRSSAATSFARAALSRAIWSARAAAAAPSPAWRAKIDDDPGRDKRRARPADPAPREPGDRQRREIDALAGRGPAGIGVRRRRPSPTRRCGRERGGSGGLCARRSSTITAASAARSRHVNAAELPQSLAVAGRDRQGGTAAVDRAC